MHKNKCHWCLGNPLYESYHDLEWGVPVYEEQKLFECLCLEIFQAGLSWLTILRKRESFREAFDNFDYQIIANYTQNKVNQLIENPSIIRNKTKIMATIHNAQAFLQVQKEFGSFCLYLWTFVAHKTIKNKTEHCQKPPVSSEISDTLSMDLKRRGFRFIGSKIIYAYMQATGMINDHEISCFRYNEV